MLMEITADELRRALTDIEAAERQGFMFCEAVLEIASASPVGNLRLRYSDLHEKAHPTSGALDWGRYQNVSKHNRFENGHLVALPVVAPSDRQER